MRRNSNNLDKKQKIKISTASRRNFIKNTSLAFGAISIIPRHVMGKGFIAPSDRINLGFIGLGKQGNILSNKFLSNTEVQIVAGSDVWDSKRAFFKTNIERLYAKHRNIESYIIEAEIGCMINTVHRN